MAGNDSGIEGVRVRLYDQIMLTGFGIHERAKETLHMIAQLLSEATVLDISNVSEYFRTQKNDGRGWRYTDFPNIAPPWETIFMEMRLESGAKDGVLFDCLSLSDVVAFKSDGSVMEDARWLIRAWPFIRIDGESDKKRFVPMMMQFGVGEKGEGLRAYGAGPFGVESYEWNLQDKHEKSLFQWMGINYGRWLIYPCLLALSFLHCKNVRLIDGPFPAKLAKAYQHRHSRPMVHYKTLEITPMKEVLRHEGQSETLGLKKALHICRGHFKDYTEKPLFGRHHGLYWWDNHVRGTAEQGIVIKDYSVNKPIESR